MMATHPLFSPEEYESLLKFFLFEGYACVDYDSVLPRERNLILRHDVDFCLQRAANLAKLESKLGLTATYFILLSSNFYNILSRHSRQSLQEVLACGHRIGLHFDPLTHDDLEKGIEREKQALENSIGEEIRIMSFHRPHKDWLNSTRRICDLAHTYEPRFFSEIGYVSDSRGGWHHGHPFDHKAVKEGRALQLLTHPIWWIHKYGKNFAPTNVLTDFADERGIILHRDIAANCTSYELSEELKS